MHCNGNFQNEEIISSHQKKKHEKDMLTCSVSFTPKVVLNQISELKEV